MNSTGYSIKDLEVLSGIKAHTIRIWEKRYNLLNPRRTKTNIRSYNDDDLRRMLNVSLLVRYGHKISKVAKWSDDAVNKAVVEITAGKTSVSDQMDLLILHMVNFDAKKFERLVDEVIAEKGIEEATTSLFFDFFVKVGLYWQTGSVFPAQEHYVSHVFRQKLIAATEKLHVNDDGALGLFFLPGHEQHELSLLFYNYVAIKNGCRTLYLGQSVPRDDLVKLEKHVHPDFIFTAFTNSVSRDDLEEYLTFLNELFYNRQIFITGLQVREHQLEMPGDITVIMNYKDFRQSIKKQEYLEKEDIV